MDVPEFQMPVYCYRVHKVLRIVDGDTYDVLLDVGFEGYQKKRLRLMGIDTWETKGPEKAQGLIAKDYAADLLLNAKKVYTQTIMDATGKYGRVLAWVWVDGECVNKLLLDEGHGVEKEY